MKLNLLLILVMLMTYSCSKKSNTEVRIKMSFSQDKGSVDNSNKNPDGDWGQSFPTTVAGVNCVAVFINDGSGSAGTCKLADANFFNANKFTGFFGKDGSVSTIVAVKDGVEFSVAAIYSASGVCPATGAEFLSNKLIYSSPHLIGKQIKNISSTTTEVELVTNFSLAVNIEDCKGIPGLPDDEHNDDGDGPTPEDPRCANAPNGAGFADGDGSGGNPFLICDVNQLQNMQSNLAAFYELGSDIEAGGHNWIPVGGCTGSTCATYFTGSFNGNNRVIHDLTINRMSAMESWNGLFGQLGVSAVVSDVKLDFLVLDGGTNSNNGAIAGLSRGATISNVYVNGDLTGGHRTGGIVGEVQGGTNIHRVKADVLIGPGGTYSTHVGGIAGKVSNANTGAVHIYEAAVFGMIDAGNSGTTTSVGGVVGAMITDYGATTLDHLIIKDAYNSASVTGHVRTGGIVGYTEDYGAGGDISIINTYNSGVITDTVGSKVGGIIGEAYAAPSTLSNSFNTGPIYSTSDNFAGFIVGNHNSVITESAIYYANNGSSPVTCEGTFSGDALPCTLEADLTNFFSSTHAVFGAWNFTAVWMESGVGFPVLKNLPMPPIYK